jgi:glycosyltransferase involved in cell wall biosynthesis
MNSNKLRIAVVIDSVPSYRRGFYESLLSSADIELTVFCQSEVKGFNLNLIHKELGENFIEVPFVSSDTHSWAWQRLPIRRLWNDFDVYFIHGNPRIISSVVWGTLFRLFGRKIVIFGQGHTAGANPTTEAIRLRWWKLFRSFLVYTDAEVEYLRERGFGDRKLVGMNNGLDQEKIELASSGWPANRLSAWQHERGLQGRTVLLSCARLIDKNRFDQMILALPGLVSVIPDLVWCVIGTGSEKEALVRAADEQGVADRIVWAGEIYGEDELAPWFLSSSLLIHPGAIGLTLMHAFGYGVPVVTHDNLEFQMPEIAAFEDGINGRYFIENDIASLQETIGALLDDKRALAAMSEAALDTVRHRFNTRIMAERFISLAQDVFAGN